MATCVRKIFKKVRPSNFLQGATVLRSTSANLSTTSTGCAYAKVREEEEIPFAQYGGRFRVTMLPGSGIGPEMMGYVKEVFR
ncbi:unnamed protein product [Cyprideis torosa]|nr:unnamed protein product [Cyprideis torosa]CAG0882495.1 unnamed protein product [Cyprideis torosa]